MGGLRGHNSGSMSLLASAGEVRPSFNMTPRFNWVIALSLMSLSTCAQYVLGSLKRGISLIGTGASPSWQLMPVVYVVLLIACFSFTGYALLGGFNKPIPAFPTLDRQRGTAMIHDLMTTPIMITGVVADGTQLYFVPMGTPEREQILITSRPRFTPTSTVTREHLGGLPAPLPSPTRYPYECVYGSADPCVQVYIERGISLTEYWDRWTPAVPSPVPSRTPHAVYYSTLDTTARALQTARSQVLTAAPTIAPILTAWARSTARAHQVPITPFPTLRTLPRAPF